LAWIIRKGRSRLATRWDPRAYSLCWMVCTPSHTIQNIARQPGCADVHGLGCRCTRRT